MNKERLYGKTLNELIAVTKRVGLPGYSARQLADWLYKKEIMSIEEMTNLSKRMRARLMAMKEVWYSFRLKKMTLNLDTDDFILNSHLVPVFTTINNRDMNLTINYNGDISLFMILTNRMISLLWIGMKYIYRTKY